VRVSSIVGLLCFAGWSVLINARERFAAPRVRARPRAVQHSVQRFARTEDRLLWN
jgi:hypothetical protein